MEFIAEKTTWWILTNDKYNIAGVAKPGERIDHTNDTLETFETLQEWNLRVRELKIDDKNIISAEPKSSEFENPVKNNPLKSQRTPNRNPFGNPFGNQRFGK